jgi:hypothetical protein
MKDIAATPERSAVVTTRSNLVGKPYIERFRKKPEQDCVFQWDFNVSGAVPVKRNFPALQTDFFHKLVLRNTTF